MATAQHRSDRGAVPPQPLVSRDAALVADARADFGDRLADRVAAVGGSWSFIIGFALVMAAWMLLNTDVLAHWNAAFDPYPYVFLNLMLSTLAAVQAPIILMSQNRQSDKDRIVAAQDYAVNCHAETEILRLHEKIDRLLEENAILIRALGDRAGIDKA